MSTTIRRVISRCADSRAGSGTRQRAYLCLMFQSYGMLGSKAAFRSISSGSCGKLARFANNGYFHPDRCEPIPKQSSNCHQAIILWRMKNPSTPPCVWVSGRAVATPWQIHAPIHSLTHSFLPPESLRPFPGNCLERCAGIPFVMRYSRLWEPNRSARRSPRAQHDFMTGVH